MKKWQKALWHGALFGMIGLVLMNGALTLQPLGPVQRWAEQFPAAAPVYAPAEEEPRETSGKGRLTLRLTDFAALPDCRVLVNGKEAAHFETATAEIEAPDFALLEIDAASCPFPVTVTVAETSETVLRPRAGEQVRVQQSTALLGVLRLKEQ